MVIFRQFPNVFARKVTLVFALVVVVLFYLGSDDGETLFWSLWIDNPFPVRPSIVLIGVVLAADLVLLKYLKFDRVFWLLSALCGLGFVGALISGNYLFAPLIMDFKLFIVVLGMYQLTKYLFVGLTLAQVVKFLFAVMALVFAVDFVQLLLNIGTEFIPGVTRVSLDSTKPLSLLLAVAFTLFIVNRKYVVLSSFGLVAVLTLSFSYGSRMVYVDLFLIVVTAAVMLGRKQFLLFLPIVLLASIVSYQLLFFVNAENAEISFNRAGSIVYGRPANRIVLDVASNIVSRIDPIRYAQFENIFLQDITVSDVVIGRGIGGFYTDDKTALNENVGTTFTDYEIENRKYFRAHTFIAHFFLKYGVVGLAVLVYIWAYPLYKFRCYLAKNRNGNVSQILLLSIFIFLPLSLIEFTWSGKGMMVAGILLAVCYYAVSLVSIGNVRNETD